jgi:hypothetical protein
MGSLGGPWVRGLTSLWGDARDKNTKRKLLRKSLRCVCFWMESFVSTVCEMERLGFKRDGILR